MLLFPESSFIRTWTPSRGFVFRSATSNPPQVPPPLAAVTDSLVNLGTKIHSPRKKKSFKKLLKIWGGGVETCLVEVRVSLRHQLLKTVIYTSFKDCINVVSSTVCTKNFTSTIFWDSFISFLKLFQKSFSLGNPKSGTCFSHDRNHLGCTKNPHGKKNPILQDILPENWYWSYKERYWICNENSREPVLKNQPTGNTPADVHLRREVALLVFSIFFLWRSVLLFFRYRSGHDDKNGSAVPELESTNS